MLDHVICSSSDFSLQALLSCSGTTDGPSIYICDKLSTSVYFFWVVTCNPKLFPLAQTFK